MIMGSVWEDARNYWGRSWFYLSRFHLVKLLKQVVGNRCCCKGKYWKLSDIYRIHKTTYLRAQSIIMTSVWVCKDYWELCSIFSCFVHCNWTWIASLWRWILENKKRSLFTRDPFTKTSLSFATAVKVWKIRFNP